VVDKSKWPRKMAIEFSADESAYLSLTEYQLLRICEKLNLTLEESVPIEVRNVRPWGRQVLVNYRENSAHVNFEVSYLSSDDCPRNDVFVSSLPGVEIKRGIRLWEIKPISTYDLDCAIKGFEERIIVVSGGLIPKELLPEENKWIKEKVGGIPLEFRGEVPIFQVTKKYEWRKDHQRLEVCREFRNCDEFTRIRFSDRILEHVYGENVSILGGKLQTANRGFLRESNFTIESLFEDLPRDVKEPPLPEIDQIQMFEIKKLEDLFLELPWQEDFRAIYSWDGISKP